MSVVQHLAKSLLDKFGLSDANPVPVPCPAGFTKKDSPTTADEKTRLEEKGKGPTQFRQRSALINFLSCWTRPDVTFAVNKLSKFMSNPGSMHWAGLTQQGLSMIFQMVTEEVQGLHGYTDARQL